MRRRGSRLRAALNSDVIFDLKNYGNDVNFKLFEVERSSDLVVASFSSNELQNGTYTTWLGGENGNLLRWKDAVSGLEMKGSKLVGDGANPCFLTVNYMADPTAAAGMYVAGNFDVPMLTGTYCVSLIHDQEYNAINQSINLGITGNDGGFFMFQWRGTGGFNGGKHFFKTTNIGDFTSDGHAYNTNPNFKIVVYKVVDSYVTDVLINGVSLTIDRAATAESIGSLSMPSKSIYLGAKLIDISSKISNYKEVGYHKDGNPADISATLNTIHSIY